MTFNWARWVAQSHVMVKIDRQEHQNKITYTDPWWEVLSRYIQNLLTVKQEVFAFRIFAKIRGFMKISCRKNVRF